MISKHNYILVTGGLGYIGSHTVVELLKLNKKVIVIDNLVNSKKTNILKIRQITKKKFLFFRIDIKEKKLDEIFKKYKINLVIHFAGLKSVTESKKKPNLYKKNNIEGTKNLINIMKKNNCLNIIFSSSACVYDENNTPPIKETSKCNPKSPYGKTKLKIENILKKEFKKNLGWNIIILRYFNPLGAHPSGYLSENIFKAENIVPNIIKVFKKKKNIFQIFGDNYKTFDGTCLRDYIHVVDLAKSHISSIKICKNKVFRVVNIGTGKPYSVRELLFGFMKYLKKEIPYKVVSRRPGDIPISYSNIQKQLKILKFRAKYNLRDMIKHTVNSVNL